MSTLENRFLTKVDVALVIITHHTLVDERILQLKEYGYVVELVDYIDNKDCTEFNNEEKIVYVHKNEDENRLYIKVNNNGKGKKQYCVLINIPTLKPL